VHRPLIGISSYGRAGKRKSFSLPCDYVDAVRRAGGVPIVLPAVEGEIPEALAAIQGLILSGGGDVDPSHYGGAPHRSNYGISLERDGFEIALAGAAITRPDLPLLCICRGMQVLNVALGGDLVAHIPDHYGDEVMHRHPERKPVEHPVRIEPESRIGHILGTTDLPVRSWHHQAVGRLGRGLRAVGWASDGVVEAVEADHHPFTIAVQWHPEVGALSDARHLRLFEALVAAAGGGRTVAATAWAPERGSPQELGSPPASGSTPVKPSVRKTSRRTTGTAGGR
jgi:putative glutamine amidotransferase